MSTYSFSAAYSTGQSKRGAWFINANQMTPPPNQYNVDISLNKSYNKKDDKYNSFKMRGPEWNFPQGHRHPIENKNNFPTANEYQPNQTVYREEYNSHQIKMHERFDKKNEKTFSTGPTTYKPSVQSSKTAYPCFSFGYQSENDYHTDVPPPGTYDPQEVKTGSMMSKTSETWKKGFGSEQRLKSKITQSPGPGEYNTDSIHGVKGPKFGFGRDKREFGSSRPNFPGPDKYRPNDKSQNNSKGFSMGTKVVNSFKCNETDAPGPGAYMPKEIKANSRILFGKDSKIGLMGKEDHIPGPGEYNQDMIKLDKCYTMAGKTIERSKSMSPGPGEYFKSGDYLYNGPQWKLGMKLQEKKKASANIPGPNNYHPNDEMTRNQSPRIGCTKGSRSEQVTIKNPFSGPGAYDVGGKIGGNKFSIGLANRFKQAPKTYEPGPGSYDLPMTIGKIPGYLLLHKKTKMGLLDFS